MIDGYADVAVVVSDRTKAKKWYTETLGFHVVLDMGHAIAVSPDAKGKSLVLHLCGDGFAPMEPGNTGIALTADDLERTCQELQQKGVQFTIRPKEGANTSMAKFLDPDGNEFWLFESSVAKQAVKRGRRPRKRTPAKRPARGPGARRRRRA
jgi:lactoylglutathione lyase